MKKFSLVLFILITTLFSSCEKDLYEENEKHSHSAIVFKDTSLGELTIAKNSPKLLEKIKDNPLGEIK